MLDRVEAHVIDMSLEVGLISNRVLPKTSLPQGIFAIAMVLNRYATGNGPMREIRLDSSPATGEIGIV